jgi:hypothetical protein
MFRVLAYLFLIYYKDIYYPGGGGGGMSEPLRTFRRPQTYVWSQQTNLIRVCAEVQGHKVRSWIRLARREAVLVVDSRTRSRQRWRSYLDNNSSTTG